MESMKKEIKSLMINFPIICQKLSKIKALTFQVKSTLK